jgi:ATP-dependent helicase/nuclease subunit B
MPLEISQDAATGLPALPWAWQLGSTPDAAWQAWALSVKAHWQAVGVEVADAVVLLPQIALLNVARQAWAQAVGGWMPRFETIGTLLDRLPQDEASVEAAPSGHPSLTLDACIDGLLVTARLRAQESGRQWARRDPGGFEFACARMMELAQQWLKAALSLRPLARQHMVEQAELWFAEALQASAGQDEPRARERVLTAMALSWAMESLPSLALKRDPVFAHRPSAWVAVTLGCTVVPGSESCLMVSVLQEAMSQGQAVLWSQAQMLSAQECVGAPEVDAARPTLAPCSDGEDEARQTASHVLAMLAQQRQGAEAEGAPPRPLALIAMDRVVTRRVRALLAPMEAAGQLLVHDESGWTLSTTRAATVVTRALVAASPRATTDDVLDWLSSAWVAVPGGASAVAALERLWRVRGCMAPWQPLDSSSSGQAHVEAMALQAWAAQALAPLNAWAQGKAGHLSDALLALKAVLEGCGALQALAADDAGQSVLAALRLADDAALPNASGEALWVHLAATTRLNWSEWTRWVDQTLEASTYMPQAAGKVPDVVIAPLSRAVLRPFAAVLLPGADDAVLGAKAGDGWLSPTDAQALGLPSATLQQQAQWEAFAVLAAQAPLLALQRHMRDGEPVGPSHWLSRWSLAAGWPLGQDLWPAPASQLQMQDVAVEPLAMPMPHLVPHAVPTSALPGAKDGAKDVPAALVSQGDVLWPQQVSASSYERLRECPYRYFALGLLGLKPLDELEEGVDRQDQGVWLHAVLKRFHEGRPPELAPADQAADVRRWLAVAQDVAAEHGLSSEAMRAHFLPYQTTLERLAEHYVRWLRGHEQQGWAVRGMESTAQAELALFADEAGRASGLSLHLYGQLDRIDARRGPEGQEAWVVDYKTGALQSLKKKVAQPQEDTQLAFYALLTLAQPEAPQAVKASYLHLDDQACTDLPHEAVVESAEQLAEGMRHDFERIWQGHALPALGEGVACDFCDARGLCRKDHWPTADAAALDSAGVAAEVQA